MYKTKNKGAPPQDSLQRILPKEKHHPPTPSKGGGSFLLIKYFLNF